MSVDLNKLLKQAYEVLEFNIQSRNEAYKMGNSMTIQKRNEAIENTMYIINKTKRKLNAN